MGTITITERYYRWVAISLTALIAALACLEPGNPPLFQHVPAAVGYLVGAAVLIGGCSRGWRLGLRLDDHGVTVRNFFRTYRISWAEVRRFQDGSAYAGEGGYNWALAVVLHDGRVVNATGTARGKEPRPETLTVIQQAAEHHAIPATLTGTAMRRGSPANPERRRKHKNIDQAPTAAAGPADPGDGTASPSDDQDERPAAG